MSGGGIMSAKSKKVFVFLVPGTCMAHSATSECGTAKHTVNHVVFQCPIHPPPHGLHGLAVQDHETIKWLLNACTKIYCHQAVDNSN